ncbi:DUF1453 domain-containing protein [Arthrobacter sp. 92]|uniref:DUF1453 domain-containing protein n=1 Tax=Arthrobacter sp. 92 TaxID=3418175 RepID=UPI003CFC8784
MGADRVPPHDDFADLVGRHGHVGGLLGASSDLLNGPIGVILGIAVVLYVLMRRLIGQQAEGKRLLLLPAILILVGLLQTARTEMSQLNVTFLLVTALASTGLGALRGSTVRIYAHDGIACLRYTWPTIALWTVSVGIQIGAHIFSSSLDPKGGAATQSAVLITVGAGLLAEGLVVLHQAIRHQHRVIWQQGKNGAPYTTSPFLDHLQHHHPG